MGLHPKITSFRLRGFSLLNEKDPLCGQVMAVQYKHRRAISLKKPLEKTSKQWSRREICSRILLFCNNTEEILLIHINNLVPRDHIQAILWYGFP